MRRFRLVRGIYDKEGGHPQNKRSRVSERGDMIERQRGGQVTWVT